MHFVRRAPKQYFCVMISSLHGICVACFNAMQAATGVEEEEEEEAKKKEREPFLSMY